MFFVSFYGLSITTLSLDKKCQHSGVPIMDQKLTNLTSIHEDAGSIPGLSQWVVAKSCGVVCRHSSDLALLWLWCRPAAVAPIGSLAWEPPCATCMALKSKERKNERERKKKEGKKGRKPGISS